jgi:hypothetical protein
MEPAQGQEALAVGGQAGPSGPVRAPFGLGKSEAAPLLARIQIGEGQSPFPYLGQEGLAVRGEGQRQRPAPGGDDAGQARARPVGAQGLERGVAQVPEADRVVLPVAGERLAVGRGSRRR